ncbi:hypothetical protein MMC17_000356 [Xylographa soralifera]|nr:hypothetical protein [Xylographa soralifera]
MPYNARDRDEMSHKGYSVDFFGIKRKEVIIADHIMEKLKRELKSLRASEYLRDAVTSRDLFKTLIQYRVPVERNNRIVLLKCSESQSSSPEIKDMLNGFVLTKRGINHGVHEWSLDGFVRSLKHTYWLDIQRWFSVYGIRVETPEQATEFLLNVNFQLVTQLINSPEISYDTFVAIENRFRYALGDILDHTDSNLPVVALPGSQASIPALLALGAKDCESFHDIFEKFGLSQLQTIMTQNTHFTDGPINHTTKAILRERARAMVTLLRFVAHNPQNKQGPNYHVSSESKDGSSTSEMVALQSRKYSSDFLQTYELLDTLYKLEKHSSEVLNTPKSGNSTSSIRSSQHLDSTFTFSRPLVAHLPWDQMD